MKKALRNKLILFFLMLALTLGVNYLIDGLSLTPKQALGSLINACVVFLSVMGAGKWIDQPQVKRKATLSTPQ